LYIPDRVRQHFHFSGFHSMQVTDFDVLIVGGGLAGLSLACALRDTRLRVALVEQRPPLPAPGWDARVYAISPVNADFLRAIGVWKHMPAERMAPISAMKIVGDRSAKLDFSAYETGVPELGWILESSLMACELWESVKRQGNLTLLCPATPKALEMASVAAALTLGDGQTVSARLLVGADGRDSWVREVLGLRAINTPYGEMGLVANFECQRPHRGIARQWFRHDGVLAWLPMAGNRVSIVWSTPDENALAMLALPAEELCTRVAAAGNHELGAFQLLTPAAAFPLRLIRVPQIVAPRLALLGDAAHGIHPLSGHGINLGLPGRKGTGRSAGCHPTGRTSAASACCVAISGKGARKPCSCKPLRTRYTTFSSKGPSPELKPLRNFGMNLTNVCQS
jgi:2-octaprenylphenol hydroxylase